MSACLENVMIDEKVTSTQTSQPAHNSRQNSNDPVNKENSHQPDMKCIYQDYDAFRPSPAQ
jgi:hypothetical protein